jgi:hypothetical protein
MLGAAGLLGWGALLAFMVFLHGLLAYFADRGRAEQRGGCGVRARSPDPSDQRVKRVSLTDRGRAALAKTLPVHEAALVRHATALSREERRTLIALLRKFVESNHQREEP